MNNKRALGSEMETLAVKHLEAKGYCILERNYYIRDAEADIIAFENNILCFIEVKYRFSSAYGSAEEAITPLKMRRMIKLAKVYLMKHPSFADMEIRFDVIAINGNDINLIKGAFEAY